MGEGAVRSTFLLLEAEDAAVLGHVGLPLGLDLQVVFHSLVADVEVLVAPVGCSHLRLSDDLGNLLLSSTKLSWSIHGENVVKDSSRFDCLEVISEVGVTIRDGAGEAVGTARGKSELKWEDWCLSLTRLSV